MSYSQPHIGMLDTTTQTIAVANTPQVVTFNTTTVNDKIAVTSSSRFTVNEAGQYLVAVSAIVTAGAANKILDLWFRVNGTDVANTNSKVTVVNNEVKKLGFTKPVTLTAGQYLEVWVSGDDTSLSLIAYAAGTTPTRPVSPSVTLIIDRIHPY